MKEWVMGALTLAWIVGWLYLAARHVLGGKMPRSEEQVGIQILQAWGIGGLVILYILFEIFCNRGSCK